jgi:hypothetical protein
MGGGAGAAEIDGRLRAIDLLDHDPGARAEFIGRIAAPIANKCVE